MLENKSGFLSLALKVSIEGADLIERGMLFHSRGCNSESAVTPGFKLWLGDCQEP